MDSLLAQISNRESDFFPEEIIVKILEDFKHYRTILRNELERTEKEWEILLKEKPGYDLHIKAMFLLAKKRDKKTFPVILRFLSLPPDLVQRLIGDIIEVELSKIIASVAHKDKELLCEFIENRERDPWLRGAAVKALTSMMIRLKCKRDWLIHYFKELFEAKLEREPSVVWNILIKCCIDIRTKKLLKHIESALSNDFLDPSIPMISFNRMKEYINEKKIDLRENLRNSELYSYIDDPIENLKWHHYSHWEPDEDFSIKAFPPLPKTPIKKPPKIGRNDPCYCGSGKKYKKCCLRLDEVY